VSDFARLIHGSAHDLPIDGKSVQMIATSPPYFGLRKYDGEQDVEWPTVEYAPMAGLPPLTVPAMRCALGNENALEAYIAHLILCAREWRRVLHETGVIFVNLGDSYASGEMGRHDSVVRRWPEGTERKKLVNTERARNQQARSVPPKNLLMVPARFALAMQADGWILRSEIIWAKPNPMPESVTDRPTKAHEMIYLFSKRERYFWDAAAVREPQSGNSHGGTLEKYMSGNRRKIQTLRNIESSNLGGVPTDYNGRNLRTVLTIPTQPYPGAHFAVWPAALVEPMIKAGSRPGDTVLDPFSGSGTTGKVALELGRRYIGVDISAEYLDDLAPDRMAVTIGMGI
jgi:DNA modification methylase